MKKVARILSAAITSAAALAFGWPTPVNLGPNVNWAGHDHGPCIAPDGVTLYYSCSNRPGGYGGADLYRSNYSGGSWQPCVNLGSVLNFSDDDYDPFYWPGTPPQLYYTCFNRPGGLGNSDIWVSSYTGGAWTAPTNVRAVNSTSSDGGSCIVGSPLRMFFSSTRSGGQGGWDIWMSTWTGSAWGTPVNIGAPVNTSAWESDPSVTADGSKLYFQSGRSGGVGQDDIWVATWTGSNWGNVQNLGTPVNSTAYEQMPGISPDGNKLYFCSNKSGGYGEFDVYCSDDTVTVAPTSLGRVKALFR